MTLYIYIYRVVCVEKFYTFVARVNLKHKKFHKIVQYEFI